MLLLISRQGLTCYDRWETLIFDSLSEYQVWPWLTSQLKMVGTAIPVGEVCAPIRWRPAPTVEIPWGGAPDLHPYYLPSHLLSGRRGGAYLFLNIEILNTLLQERVCCSATLLMYSFRVLSFDDFSFSELFSLLLILNSYLVFSRTATQSDTMECLLSVLTFQGVCSHQHSNWSWWPFHLHGSFSSTNTDSLENKPLKEIQKYANKPRCH